MLNGIDSTIILVLNLFGTFVFALSGAMAAVRSRLDVFGIVVLGGTVGLAGGIVRDLFIGIPPQTFRDWRYILTVTVAGLIVTLAHRVIMRLQRPVDLLDAVGLAVFCVTGAAIALQHGLGATEAIMLGTITAVGGGLVRDLFLNRIPTVLRSELYAIPALVGASFVAIPDIFDHDEPAWWFAGAVVCFVIRLAGMSLGIDAPRPVREDRWPDTTSGDEFPPR